VGLQVPTLAQGFFAELAAMGGDFCGEFPAKWYRNQIV
jgi:hypothetical protein